MNNNQTKLEILALRFTRWVGSTSSIVLHTILFILSFVFVLLGADLNKVLLVLTTAVSLEAIYLAIFIQMSVNHQAESIKEVEENLDEIQDDVGEIQEDIDEIQDDVVEISADIDEMQDEEAEENTAATIERIHTDLKRLVEDISKLKNQSTKPTQE